MNTGGYQRRKWTVNEGHEEPRRAQSTHDANLLFGIQSSQGEALVRPEDIVHKLRTT